MARDQSEITQENEKGSSSRVYDVADKSVRLETFNLIVQLVDIFGASFELPFVFYNDCKT